MSEPESDKEREWQRELVRKSETLKQTCPQQREREREKETQLLDSCSYLVVMFMTKKTCEQPKGLKQHLIQKLLYCTGEMEHFHTYMQDQAFLMQLLEWLLRGVSGVIMVNNPLSGALILIALSFASPWQALLGSLGLLSSTVMAILIGQEQAEVSRGEHGYNGMLVALLIGVFSNAG
ncbi:hypothetical protein PDJAM_G00198850, partial [Pangasius djambal]|nr:hypothetical protein [Pangasius djambal]